MVYLIHFDEPFKHAQHYIGFTQFDSVESRIEYHRKGLGSKLLKAVTNAGINWSVARTWPEGDRTFERRLKNRKNAKCLCPICIKRLGNKISDT